LEARFEEEGIAGLDPRHKGSQPRVANAQVQARIARKTQQKPADGSTHWSCRKMAAALRTRKLFDRSISLICVSDLCNPGGGQFWKVPRGMIYKRLDRLL